MDADKKKVVALVVALVAVAAAVFSITHTVKSNQGKSVGTMSGFQGKAALMKEQNDQSQANTDAMAGAPPGGAPPSSGAGTK
jgi:hypothetical protein